MTTEYDEVQIDRGQEIIPVIERFMLDKKRNEAVIVNAIGSVKDLLFAAPVQNELPLKVGVTPCLGAAEILTFTGEIMPKGKMDPDLRAVYPDKESPLFIHIHASCARAGGIVMGGGLRGGRAFRSLRVFLRYLS